VSSIPVSTTRHGRWIKKEDIPPITGYCPLLAVSWCRHRLWYSLLFRPVWGGTAELSDYSLCCFSLLFVIALMMFSVMMYGSWCVYAVATVDHCLSTIDKQLKLSAAEQDATRLDEAFASADCFARRLNTQLNKRNFICGSTLAYTYTRNIRWPSANILCRRPSDLWPLEMKIGASISYSCSEERSHQFWFFYAFSLSS